MVDRVAEIREGVEFLDGWDIDAAWVDAVCAAARAYADLLENGPDYEAAAKWLQAGWEADAQEDEEFGEPPYEWDDLDEIVKQWWRDTARGAIAAALPALVDIPLDADRTEEEI